VDWVTRIVVASIREGQSSRWVFHWERHVSHQHRVRNPDLRAQDLERRRKEKAPARAGAVECDDMRYWFIVGALCRLEELCSSCLVKTMKILVSAGTETTTLLFELRFMISVSPAVPIFSATR